MPKRNNTKIPDRLLRKGRVATQNFQPVEKLFLRFNKLLEENGYIYPSSIHFPAFSVNREKFSEPNDVLLKNYLDWGIAAFKVEDIPDDTETEQNDDSHTVYSFKAVHCPEDFNYAHSEVHTERNGSYKENIKIKSKIVKRYFKYTLSGRINIIKDSKI